MDTQALTGGTWLADIRFRLARDALIHHLLLRNGDIVDLLVHSDGATAERGAAAHGRLQVRRSLRRCKSIQSRGN